ncbi:aminopeptidase [Hyalangium versicolor]|uniref:aminopeptidase n=1 Tax=Hyalangium versicolor TaxID=2861190 RepID=UPI001CC93A8D|nr:aminopeptidase [Hyalangium versicolor]
MNTKFSIEGVADISAAAKDTDALVVVAPAPLKASLETLGLPQEWKRAVEAALSVDRALAEGSPGPTLVAAPSAPGGRIIVSPTAPITYDTDDCRVLSEASAAAIARAVQAGASHPLLAVGVPKEQRFARTLEVCALSSAATAWEPLEARESPSRKAPPTQLRKLSVLNLSSQAAARASALETGRALCRDLVTGGPERLTPLRFAAYCEEAFGGTGVKVSVQKDVSGYPLLAAVARASMVVEHHRPCVVTLELVPEGPVTRTVLFAGKGVTYDMGGADLKTNGGMAGMSRDKGGAATVAGLIRALAELKIPGLRVIAQLGMVRNSIGEESFVSDEIITSRAGVRVRIGNTDAEGRLVLADLLAALKEGADPATSVLVSVATLTGHVYRAFGPYVGAIENGAARAQGFIRTLSEAGELLGEPLESTVPRREDYLFVAPKAPTEDVLSSNRLASVDTPRGHQGPFAFIDVTSGLRSSKLPFVHLDISGVVVTPADWQAGKPTASPIAALVEALEVRQRG